MPRVPSITLRLARVLGSALVRFEDKLAKDPTYIPSEAETRVLLNMARADALVQGRKPVDGEDEEPTGKADPKQAAALVERIRSGMTQNPTASRVEGDDDSDDT